MGPNAAAKPCIWSKIVLRLFVEADPGRELGVAQWVYAHKQMAGLHTDTLPSINAIYLPLLATRGIVGVLAVRPADPRRLLAPDQRHLLETFANGISVAIERAHLADEARDGVGLAVSPTACFLISSNNPEYATVLHH